MAKRQIGVERLFNLGQYKNLRLTELVEVNDEDMTEQELEALRMIMLLNVYQSFGMHKVILSQIAEAEAGSGEALLEFVANKLREVRETFYNEEEVTDAKSE